MNRRPTLRESLARHGGALGALAFLAGALAICLLRAWPSFFRGTYATEGGEWLARIWRGGFLHTVVTTREDYCVLGNLLVIQAANLLTKLVGGHELAPVGPALQHVAACVWVALTFLVPFNVLRRHHGWKTGAVVAFGMLLVPDIDGENRIFGEANNVGFFSGVVVAFIGYDLWASPTVSRRRLAGWLALAALHILTSPLAGLVAAGSCSLVIARDLLAWRATRRFPRRVLALALPVLLTAATLWRAQHHGPSATLGEEPAGTESHFAARFVECVLGRQLLYPFVAAAWGALNDRIVLAGTAVFSLAVAAGLFLAPRRGVSWASPRLQAWLLLLGMALAMAVTTVWSRRWLVARANSYADHWPSRYYLVQTMLVTACGLLGLAHVARRFPASRRWIGALVAAWLGSFIVLQVPAVHEVVTQDDPALVAKHWAHQLGRVHDARALSGTADDPARVPMYIEGHFLPVPAALLHDYEQQRHATRPDRIELRSTPEPLTHERGRDPRRADASQLRVIPRPGGALVTFDLRLPATPSFAARRRKLWLHGGPAVSQSVGYFYSAVTTTPPATGGKVHPGDLNWLFIGTFWLPGATDLSTLEAQLRACTVGIGEKPGECLALGRLCPLRDEPAWSAVADDLALEPAPVRDALLHWSWQPTELKAEHLTLVTGGLRIEPATAADFDEAAYLRLNPDLAAAFGAGILAKPRAYFDAFDARDPREICARRVTLPVSAPFSAAALRSVSFRLAAPRLGPLPEFVRLTLAGAAGDRAEFAVRPVEGLSTVFAIAHLPPLPDFAVTAVTLEFPGERARQFRLEEVTLSPQPNPRP